MIATVLAAVGLHANMAGIIREACKQLGVDGAGLTMPAALQACNEAIGIQPTGPLLAQTLVLAEQLGIIAGAQPPQQPAVPDAAIPPLGADSLPVHAVMSAPSMVHQFSDAV